MTWHEEVAALHEEVRLVFPSLSSQGRLHPFNVDPQGLQLRLPIDSDALEFCERRRSDILALHYYHFDFKACTVQIMHPKRNMYGVLPLSRGIIKLVERLYADADEADPVFPKDPLPYHAFERLCRQAGIRHHRFHDFRISTSMIIKSGGFDASLAALWV